MSVEVSSLGAVWSLLHDHYLWHSSSGSLIWDTASLLANENTSLQQLTNLLLIVKLYRYTTFIELSNDVRWFLVSFHFIHVLVYL